MNRESTTGFVLLGVLATTGPASGYEIRRFIQQSVGHFWSESYGQIYPQLKALEASGLVEPVDSGGSVAAARTKGTTAAKRATSAKSESRASERGRKRVRITNAGRRVLKTWLEAPARSERVRVEFLVKLFFGHEASPAASRAHVQAVAKRNRERLDFLERIGGPAVADDAGAPQLVYWLLALRHGLVISRARVRWSEEAVRLLDAAERGGNRALLTTWRNLMKENA